MTTIIVLVALARMQVLRDGPPTFEFAHVVYLMNGREADVIAAQLRRAKTTVFYRANSRRLGQMQAELRNLRHRGIRVHAYEAKLVKPTKVEETRFIPRGDFILIDYKTLWQPYKDWKGKPNQGGALFLGNQFTRSWWKQKEKAAWHNQ